MPRHFRTIGVGYREEYPDSHPALAQAEELAELLGAEVRLITAEPGGPEAARTLAQEGERLDLLVLGSRHFPAPAAAVVSSVSSRIAAAPPCPLLVVPGPALVHAD
jgi:nucleotide-binding universal stress UspA family protein